MAAGWNALLPGCATNSTPTSPMPTAIQRRSLTLSPRNSTDSTVMNSGEAKLMAVASAIGRERTPRMNSPVEETRQQPRSTCTRGRCDRSAPKPPRSSSGRTVSTAKVA